MKTLKSITAIALAGTILLMTSSVHAEGKKKGRAHGTPTVYVMSQDLYYDTIPLGELKYNGKDNFQLLVIDETEFYGTPLVTEFGPTDTGYYGGRWWVDSNPNGYMDEEDTYFLCPLLGPGRTEL